MGLAGRKVKQRIPADPRNLSWADDASRFGQAYLSKFGWDATQGVGLGASGDGMKSNLKVSQKLDMLGIGAAHQKDPHGIAWRQNRDFEVLLKRLNEGANKDEAEEEENGVVEQGGFVSATEGKVQEDAADCGGVDIARDKKRKRKRKHLDESDGSEEQKKKKERKQKDEMQSTREHSVTQEVVDDTVQNDSAPTSSSVEATATDNLRPKIKGRPMAHRARFQAAKRLATKSTAAISEILGIAPSSSTPSSSLVTPRQLSPTPESSSAPEDTHPSLEQLTTSTKSLADYFKDKLSAKKSTVSTPTPSSGDDDYDRPRSGLGASRTLVSSSGADGAPQQRIGLGFVSSTSASTPSLPSLENTPIAQETLATGYLNSRSRSGGDQENRKNTKRKKDKNTGDVEIENDSRHEDGETKNLADTSVINKSTEKKRKEAKVKVTSSDKTKRKSKKGSDQDTLPQ